MATQALKNKDVFWTDDATKVPGANLDAISKYQIKQLLAVPLLGSDGRVFGMFGILDRLEGQSITQEDIRRARALAAQAAVALEATRNLHLSDRHRDRAEALMSLARELSSLLQLPEFVRNFAARAAELLQARAAALVQLQDESLETAVLRNAPERAYLEPKVLKRLSRALAGVALQPEKNFVYASAKELLGAELAEMLSWNDCTLVRMTGASGALVGLLCLADRGRPVTADDHGLLEAIASHASIALENARLFTRMERASRHWMEIFDAITDFIVVHDEAQNILRVNLSLADFIGVPPSELVGVNMRALEALSASAPHSCPFCRTGNGNDDYVYSVMERTYLVSTSRIHGASTETLQTVHVLKDITDRREALKAAGFTVHRMTFKEPGADDVENLYARIGTAAPHLMLRRPYRRGAARRREGLDAPAVRRRDRGRRALRPRRGRHEGRHRLPRSPRCSITSPPMAASQRARSRS